MGEKQVQNKVKSSKEISSDTSMFYILACVQQIE